MQKPVVITMGDAAGIGPEIIAKVFREHSSILRGCFVAGDVQTLRRAAAVVTPQGRVALPVAVLSSPEQAVNAPAQCIPVLQIGAAMASQAWGKVSPVAGEFAGRCVVWAANAALRGDVAAMVTAPLHKAALSAAGLPYSQYPGHTELLQSLAAQHLGKTSEQVPVRMMLANDELRTVLVSIHLSLRNAIESVTFDNVFQTLCITHVALFKALGRVPHIAVAALNPHAGEGGLFGREELETIIPAIDAARLHGCHVSGPWPPDTVFMQARKTTLHPSEIDVVVAMYHDQGLIPVKYLGVEKGVNITLGLPLVRTSPDHGTAFDIAGTGKADASSLVEAVRMAKQLSIF